jgi:hypothetical protein
VIALWLASKLLTTKDAIQPPDIEKAESVEKLRAVSRSFGETQSPERDHR